jgi:hypothetical protein
MLGTLLKSRLVRSILVSTTSRVLLHLKYPVTACRLWEIDTTHRRQLGLGVFGFHVVVVLMSTAMREQTWVFSLDYDLKKSYRVIIPPTSHKIHERQAV